jgi:metal-responsive CopG/Arc/MetJ family transcriptional regulator
MIEREVMKMNMKTIKRNIVVKLDYDIVSKVDAMVKENKKLHYRSQVVNNILTEYFNTRMK